MRQWVRTLVLFVAAVSVSSCSVINVNSLPQPGTSYGDGYDIVMAFENVLNLPMRARVIFNGINVGVVTDMKVTSREVDVTARMAANTKVPSNTQASLQQATVLGDIYIALEQPEGERLKAPPLRPGGRIPLNQTISPPQLEDTIAGLANVVSSGSIQRLQNTVIRLNRMTPPPTEVRRLTARVVDDLTDLSDNLDQVDQLVDGASKTVEVLHERIPQLDLILSQQGQLNLTRSVAFTTYIATVLPGVGSIVNNGWWLYPFLNSLATSVGVLFQRSKFAFEQEIPRYRKLFTDFFLPQDKFPAINITSIVGPDGRELSGNVEDVLRILGAVQ